MMAKELSGRAYTQVGVPDSHHSLSHHQNDPVKLNKIGKINAFHMQQFAYFVDRMRGIEDGDGSLLDHSMLVYGAAISDGNAHLYDDLPIALLGGSAFGLKGGRHLRFPSDTPLSNLFLTLLDKLGVPTEQLGDSTGKLEHLSV